ncbi:MAG TPA: MMPL family transporter [Acidimicrobiales bacterium]
MSTSTDVSAGSAGPTGGFARLGRWCHRRRFVVVLLWVAAVVVGGSVLGVVGTETRTEFSLPDVESRRGVEIFEEHFGGRGSGQSGSIVFVAEEGVDDPVVRSQMQELFDEVEQMDSITVTSPYSEEGAGQVAQRGEYEDRLAFARVEMGSDVSFEESQRIGDEIRREAPDLPGLRVVVGGEMFAGFEEPTAELVGVAFAIVILIVAFGSVIAMGLPVGVGLAGILVGTILAGFLTHVFEVPDFSQMVGLMIGLGVGIDYALFIVTRFRENRRAGLGVERSITVALDTAGRAVTFAGITVVISLLGMTIMQLGFVTGMAVSAATVVAVTMLASLTLLPALIGFVAERMETTRWRGIIAAGGVSVALIGVAFSVPAMTIGGVGLAVVVLLAGFVWPRLRRELPPRRQPPVEQTLPYRWSRVIQHHPWPAALVGAAILAVLALPVFGLRLGFADEGNYPEDTDTRVAYDLVAEGFGPGYNGPLLLASELPDGVDRAALEDVTAALRSSDGVARVAPPMLNEPDDPDAVTWQVIPTTSPQDEATSDLVEELRSDTLPEATSGTGLDVAVAGSVATAVDFTDYLGDRLVVFFAAVLALSFVLLMVVFRSVLVPLKAVIMNLLGIGAAYGVVIAIFQWGWLGSAVGIAPGPIEPFMPMMLFAIVFGLSMDYEVFLLSRIREDYDRTRDSHTSVANGLAATARVISAAAAIMIVVFGAFALSEERVLKLAGIGLGAAVFLDATIIRMLLVPATMELLGDRNWWLPRWLDRILPSVDVEGHAADEVEDDRDRDRDRELEPVG